MDGAVIKLLDRRGLVTAAAASTATPEPLAAAAAEAEAIAQQLIQDEEAGKGAANASRSKVSTLHIWLVAAWNG